jgi:hypothetical protein
VAYFESLSWSQQNCNLLGVYSYIYFFICIAGFWVTNKYNPSVNNEWPISWSIVHSGVGLCGICARATACNCVYPKLLILFQRIAWLSSFFQVDHLLFCQPLFALLLSFRFKFAREKNLISFVRKRNRVEWKTKEQGISPGIWIFLKNGRKGKTKDLMGGAEIGGCIWDGCKWGKERMGNKGDQTLVWLSYD